MTNPYKNYRIRCYKRSGDLDHEEYADTLEEAKDIRAKWGSKIGLQPEPSLDFAFYPTIWEKQPNGSYMRIPGY